MGGVLLGTAVPADPTGATAVPGVWVAGNVTDPMAQVIAAAAAGLRAGAMINADLVEEETRDAVAARGRRPDGLTAGTVGAGPASDPHVPTPYASWPPPPRPTCSCPSRAAARATGPTGRAPPATWTAQELTAEVGADQAPVLAASGDDALVLARRRGRHGALPRVVGGADFEAGEPLATGARLPAGRSRRCDWPDGDWFVLGPAGCGGRATPSGWSSRPVGLRSSDGLRLGAGRVDGFAHPVEVADLQVVGDTLVAAGTYRTAAALRWAASRRRSGPAGRRVVHRDDPARGAAGTGLPPRVLGRATSP